MAYGSCGSMLMAISMISLVGGMWLLLKTWKEELCCKLFPKIVGYAVVVLSIVLILLGGYQTITEGTCGHHRGEKGMMRGMGGMMPMMHPKMMKEMMKNRAPMGQRPAEPEAEEEEE